MDSNMEDRHEYTVDENGEKVDMGYDFDFGQRHVDSANENQTWWDGLDTKYKSEIGRKAQSSRGKARQFSMTKAKGQDQADGVPEDGNVKEGSVSFMKWCAGCHGLETDSTGKKNQGPAMGLVYGRMAGGDQGYRNYSTAVVQSTALWSISTLMKMMESTDRVVPGMKCGLRKFGRARDAHGEDGKSMLDQEDIRLDIAAFLKEFSVQNYRNGRIRNRNRFKDGSYSDDYKDKKFKGNSL